jgi:ribosomal protein S27AE
MRTLRPDHEDKFRCHRCGRPTSKLPNPYFRAGQALHEFHRACNHCGHVMIVTRDMEALGKPETVDDKPATWSWIRWLKRRR